MEGANPMHFPHPPLAPRYHYGLHPFVAEEPAGHSQLVSFPTAPCAIGTHSRKYAGIPGASVLLEH